mmetsp:Transcript_24062/g.54861  ORF Transcript_24062/g.54861 Transcript_24062/m.54861 type:complete len:95 (+) Transcript_24062:2393-2677(+)
MLNDRVTINQAQSQIGFIEFLVAPLACATVKLLPMLHPLWRNMCNNSEKWRDVWIMQSKPDAEEIAKVERRIQRVADSLPGPQTSPSRRSVQAQ